MAVLVTGGAGFVGSHVSVELLEAGHEVVVLDNFSNSKRSVMERINEITERPFAWYEVDLLDRTELQKIFTYHDIEAVIHCAGLKSVSESVSNPLQYYDTNVRGTLNLCQVMNKYHVKKMVFSSSATVYGAPDAVPISETAPLAPTNPYGKTKWMIEELLTDMANSDSKWSIALLRYFNPIGAHESGRLGELPSGTPNNLMPYISQVAIGQQPYLKVFGNDYPTRDGTGVRDYIHIMDLAKGHVAALEYVKRSRGAEAFNLGTGQGYSVIELVTAFEKETDQFIPFLIKERRPGDVASSFAEVKKAQDLLQWKAEKTLEDMCRDAWRWQVHSSRGYPL